MQLHLWMEEALCRRVNNDFWYPPLEASNQESYYSIGRELCHRCPVWKQCLEVGKDESWGMWGGLTPNERTVFHTKHPRPTNVRPHGSWLRYRQGCECAVCRLAHEKPTSNINTKVLPGWQENIDDLEMLRFSLLSPPKKVD